MKKKNPVYLYLSYLGVSRLMRIYFLPPPSERLVPEECAPKEKTVL